MQGYEVKSYMFGQQHHYATMAEIEDANMPDAPAPAPNIDPPLTPGSAHNSSTKRRHPPSRGREITQHLIKTPPHAYAHLALITSAPSRTSLDAITVRAYLASALMQFLGISGAAIAVDILKLEEAGVWVRVPREDLAPFLAAVGGWVGEAGRVGWRVLGSGNWLSELVGREEDGRIWGD
ncbi:hypothetical protein BJ878DRAFT_91733 [Calycina marina]|uniref:Ribonucleases P/MRP subunit Pop8-like domain-containing protein n=1 Tax=Calycina marina TaxID=1763456 RepID=A0A9P7ZBT5_9HELO|nr:hypothetical protein BJ878DRAFT_91733 [Calycina marina]